MVGVWATQYICCSSVCLDRVGVGEASFLLFFLFFFNSAQWTHLSCLWTASLITKKTQPNKKASTTKKHQLRQLQKKGCSIPLHSHQFTRWAEHLAAAHVNLWMTFCFTTVLCFHLAALENSSTLTPLDCCGRLRLGEFATGVALRLL